MMWIRGTILLATLSLCCTGCNGGMLNTHHGVKWNEIRDDRWETPLGRVFPVSDNRDISDLQDELEPGDVMVMRPGEWVDARVNISSNGTSEPGRKIYLVAESLGLTQLTGKVQLVFTGQYIEMRGMWIDGTSDDKITPVWFEPSSRHCRLTNSAITNFNREVHDKAHHWVEIFGGYHTIDWNALEEKKGNTGQLVRVKTTNGDFKPPGAQPESWGHHISWNYFGPRPDTTEDNGEGIQIGLMESQWVDTDTYMEFNLFDEYDAEIECISVKASNNTVRYNTFRNSACSITLRHTDRSLVEENYVFCEGKYGCGGVRAGGDYLKIINNYIEKENFDQVHRAGIVFYTGNSEEPRRRAVRDSVIERNMILDCKHCFIFGAEGSEGGDIPSDNNTFVNNVMTGLTDEDYIVWNINMTNPIWRDNIAYRGIIDNEADYFPGIVRRDPQLVYDPDFEIWKPTDAGFEFEMTYPPLHREDVGPSWKNL